MDAKKEEREAFEAWWKHTGGGSVSERHHSLIAWEARAEVASLKDEDAFSQTVIAEQGRKIDDLTQQLAAAKDDAKTARVEAECLAASCKSVTEQLAAANGRLERMREALEKVNRSYLESTHSDDHGYVEIFTDATHAAVEAAISDLPEADKEKTK